MPDLVLSRVPLRISLLGGGSDYPLYTDTGRIGCVLLATINQYVYVICRRRHDHKILAHYSRREEVEDIEELRNEYIREALRFVGCRGGIEVSSQMDIGVRGGLGGSAAFLVGLLQCLHALRVADDPGATCLPLRPMALAREAFELESGPLGRKVGLQDHYAAAMGGLREYHFHPEGEVRVASEPAAPWFLAQRLLLLPVNDRGGDGDRILEDMHELERRPDVIEINQEIARLAFLGAHLAQAGDWHGCLSLIGQSWDLKCKTSKHISNAALDDIYSEVCEAGALGGKLCGVGGGGHFLFYCPDGKKRVLERLGGKYREIPFELVDEGATILLEA